jgi:hypothetical protein
LVILGAGLDGGVWRMAELADVEAYEVDHPASQRDKRERVGQLPTLAARAMSAAVRRPSLWRSEPRRSSWTPTAMRGLLARHGLTVDSDEDLLTIAQRLPMPVHLRRSPRNGRVATATVAPRPAA